MNLYRWIIAGLWLLFVAYWAVAAVGAKRSASKRRWDWEIGLRLVLILLIVALLQSRSLRQFLAETQRPASHSDFLGWTGVALCVLGFGLAITARRELVQRCVDECWLARQRGRQLSERRCAPRDSSFRQLDGYRCDWLGPFRHNGCEL